MAPLDDDADAPVQPDAPSGAAGTDTGRDPRTGQFMSGNRAAMIVGDRSVQFWQACEGTRRDIVTAVLQDSGHTLADAPRALRLAAEGIAQAALVRDAAFDRMVETGGPLTSRDRGRRSLTVWLAASDRLLRHLQVIGLERQARRLDLAAAFREDQP